MILFQLDPDSDEVLDVFLDHQGLDQLRGILDRIEAGSSHDHLMTPAWAGTELSAVPRNKGRLINQVNIGLINGGAEGTGV